jgi:hypothetical protein
MGDVGTFHHELRITLNDMQYVVYPMVGHAATFSVVQSLTWNAETQLPRISREDARALGARLAEEAATKSDRQIRDDVRRNKQR